MVTPVNACPLPSTAYVVLAALARNANPTYPELMAATDLSRSRVHGALLKLRHLGLVAWEPGTAGTITARFAIVVGWDR